MSHNLIWDTFSTSHIPQSPALIPFSPMTHILYVK